MLNTAMGTEFDALVLIGGERGVDKLAANPHARRNVNHFLEAQKPIAAIGAGVALLALSPKSAGREVAAPADAHAALKAANCALADTTQTTDAFVLTSNGGDVDAWVEAAMTLFSEATATEESAAA
jgi:protease I